jgi:hypothetical protein
MKPPIASAPRTLATAVAVAAALALALTPSAHPNELQPLVTLGPVTSANGLAALSGTVGGTSPAAVELKVNGQPLAVSADGRFAGVLSLNGASALHVSLLNPLARETTTISVPLTLGVGGVIPAGTVDAVEQAVRSVLQPPGGFTIVDGLPLQIQGRVLDGGELTSMQVNGIDALNLLGRDGTFVAQLPGTTREISVTTVDRSGTSAVFAAPVRHLSTADGRPSAVPGTSQTAQLTSVSAAAAAGVRIAKIRYVTRGVFRTHRIRMLVTVKDRLGRLVRGATIQIRSARPGKTIRRRQVKRSSRVGTAAFLVRVRRRALGTRLVIVTSAWTPTARTKKKSSVRLQRMTRKSQR